MEEKEEETINGRREMARKGEKEGRGHKGVKEKKGNNDYGRITESVNGIGRKEKVRIQESEEDGRRREEERVEERRGQYHENDKTRRDNRR